MSVAMAERPAKRLRLARAAAGKQAKEKKAKRWYFQSMGEQVGPISSQRLWVLAQQRHVRPETFVRRGEEGKWILAERVKGLFDPNFPTSGIFIDVAEQEESEESAAAHEVAQKLHRKDKLLAVMARRNRLQVCAELGIASLGFSLTMMGLAIFLLSSQQLAAFQWGSPRHLLALALTGGGVVVSVLGAFSLSMWAKR